MSEGDSAAPAPVLTKKVKLGLDDDVENLLLWKDVKQSGIVFGSITLAYLLLEWSGLSLITILANLMMLGVLVAFVWANVGSMLGKHGPPVPDVFKKGVSDGDLKPVVEAVKAPLNLGLAFLGRLAAGKEWKLSAIVIFVSYILAKVGSIFSLLGLLYTIVFLAFSLPKLYELKKDEVDKGINLISDKVSEVYKKVDEQVLSKIPKGANAKKFE